MTRLSAHIYTPDKRVINELMVLKKNLIFYMRI